MNYAEIRKFDVTNGPGIRVSLFVSGCTNNCEGCFNKDLQDFNYGTLWTDESEELFISYLKNSNIKGVNILGGDPMDQIRDKSLLRLLKRIKEETNHSIWLWSGYLYEDIIMNSDRNEILNFVDVLIDGRFQLDKRDIKLKFRGSGNQRVIDIIKTRENGKVVEVDL